MLRLVREFHQPYEIDQDLFSSDKEHSLRLHAKGISMAKAYRFSESDLLDILRELDDDKTFLLFKCTSLKAYSMKYHRLSESVVLNLINIMRKTKDVPELASAIRSGSVDISKARKITPVLNSENKAKWLDIAATQSLRDVEKAVAEAKPETSTNESLKATRAKSRQEKKGSDDKTPAASKHHDARLAKDVPGQPIEGARQRFTAETIHAVNLRDKCQCTEPDETGERCESRRWLDIHHIVEVSQGGSSDPENLRTLCSAHHRMIHRR